MALPWDSLFLSGIIFLEVWPANQPLSPDPGVFSQGVEIPDAGEPQRDGKFHLGLAGHLLPTVGSPLCPAGKGEEGGPGGLSGPGLGTAFPSPTTWREKEYFFLISQMRKSRHRAAHDSPQMN